MEKEQHQARSKLYSLYGSYGGAGDSDLRIAKGKFNGKTVKLSGTFFKNSWGPAPGQTNTDKFVCEPILKLGYGNC